MNIDRSSRGQSTRLRRLLRDRLALGGAFSLLVVAFAAIFARLIAPADPLSQSLSGRLQPPSWALAGGMLGTDSLGRDVLSRLIFGTRVTLLVGFGAVAIAGSLGIILGVYSGYLGGILDDVVTWMCNTLLAFPLVLLALVFAVLLGRGLQNIILVLGLTGWVPYTRVARNAVFANKPLEYVLAARTTGCSSGRIIFRHILPNVLAPLIVIASYELARMIIMEAALSFLGLGVSPSTPSWGTMLADGREYLSVGWWIVTFPGLAISVTVASVNALGDWLRDELDPHLRRRR